MARIDKVNLKPEPDEDYRRDEVWPLRTIWDNEPDINQYTNYRQLESWSMPRKRATNDFPDPAEMVGRFTFYDPEQVLKWFKLWRKANKNFHMPKEVRHNAKG